MGTLDAGRHGQLGRAVGQQETARARVVRSGERLVDAQVAPWLPVVVAVIERRLADEEVAVAGEVGQSLARAAVARIGDRAPVPP